MGKAAKVIVGLGVSGIAIWALTRKARAKELIKISDLTACYDEAEGELVINVAWKGSGLDGLVLKLKIVAWSQPSQWWGRTMGEFSLLSPPADGVIKIETVTFRRRDVLNNWVDQIDPSGKFSIGALITAIKLGADPVESNRYSEKDLIFIDDEAGVIGPLCG